MENGIRIKYDAKLSIKANAEKCGVSVSTMRIWLRAHKIDRRFDSMYLKYTTVKKLQRRTPLLTAQQIAKKTGYSLNTVKKYMKMDCLEKRKDRISVFDISKKDNIVKSVSSNQQEILSNILKLHVPQGTYDADFTFSVGNFYKDGVVPMPQLKFDKFPAFTDVKPLEDAENIADGSLNSCVVDLPFLITQRKWADGSKMAHRFNSFDNVDEAKEANIYMLSLSHKKLRKGGVLVFKTMDIYKNNRQIWMSFYVIKWTEMKFTLIDTFILISPSKVLSSGMHQKVSRKYHSYFFVFKKV